MPLPSTVHLARHPLVSPKSRLLLVTSAPLPVVLGPHTSPTPRSLFSSFVLFFFACAIFLFLNLYFNFPLLTLSQPSHVRIAFASHHGPLHLSLPCLALSSFRLVCVALCVVISWTALNTLVPPFSYISLSPPPLPDTLMYLL